MVPRSSYPPTLHHDSLTQILSPKSAQSHLATFLEKASTHSHLHPDSLLSTTGITYSAHSGPSGGLAIHHLRRIEAGLRGENLVAETEEELKHLAGNGEHEDEGNDVVLDESIARTERRERKKEGRKRKRVEEIQDWAEDASSSQADVGVEVPAREIESFAHTPLHESDYQGEGQGDWQDQRYYEFQQWPLEGEVGEREGAPVQRQNVDGPGLVKHGGGGGKKELTREEKKARKDAKKARQIDRKEKGRTG